MIDPFNPEAIDGRPRPVREREGVIADALFYIQQAIPKKQKEQPLSVNLAANHIVLEESDVSPIIEPAMADLTEEQARALVEEAQRGN